MGSKGLKAIIIDPGKTGPVETADPEAFRRLVKSWVNTLKHDVSCSLYSRFGTPFAVSNSASQGTLPTLNYRSGRPEDFIAVSGNSIQKILFERGGRMHGRMHGCMPGCVVRCSIIYPRRTGFPLSLPGRSVERPLRGPVDARGCPGDRRADPAGSALFQ